MLSSPKLDKNGSEFKPFIRRLPEFKFWHSATRAVVFALLATLTSATDVPVFWPILVVSCCSPSFYFIGLLLHPVYPDNEAPDPTYDQAQISPLELWEKGLFFALSLSNIFRGRNIHPRLLKIPGEVFDYFQYTK